MANKDPFQVTLAGFGGQGILFAGKVMAYAGLLDGKEIAWLPSYGPEMRGGTCNCSVTLSTEMIGALLFSKCDALIAMNQPSFDKFMPTVREGGVCVYDSTLITPGQLRDDIQVFGVPATEMAETEGLKGLANIILLGKLFAVTGCAGKESVVAAIPKCVSSRRPEMVEFNNKALELGAAQ